MPPGLGSSNLHSGGINTPDPSLSVKRNQKITSLTGASQSDL